MSKFIFFTTSLLLLSCTGTVENVAKENTLTEKKEKSDVEFAGVQLVKPISHNKLEVYFFPATGGSGKYSYRIFFGGEPVPAVTSSDILNTDYRGLLMFTLTGLDSARDYIIRVDVVDQITGRETKTTAMVTAKTFASKVSDFYGLSEVSNLPGIDGIDSIKVRWVHAECFDPLRCDQPSDPASYEVILLDRTNKGRSPADFDNRDLAYADGRIVKTIGFDPATNSTTVRGLQGDTEYYIIVRSIHNNSLDDFNNPQLRGELNNSYLQIKTLSNNLASINFDTSSLLLSKFSGEDAFNSLQADWTPAVGVFDHFRLFYATDAANLSAGTIPTACQNTFAIGDNATTTILCKKVNSTGASAVVTDLLAQTTYDFILVLCQNVECSPGNRIIADKKQSSTEGEDPVFGGINSILLADSPTNLNSLYLEFTPIDFSVSSIDGYVVEYKSNPDPSVGAEYAVLEDIDPDYTVGNLSIESFDYLTANTIEVVGVEYYSTNTYCFRIFPFVYDSNGDKVFYENDNWSCINSPEYISPTAQQFAGLQQTITQSTQVTLRWNPPAGGIYEVYELYYVNRSSGLSLFGSIPIDLDNNNTSSNYGRFLVHGNQTELTLSGFEDGDEYQFGILTRFNSSRGTLRSEENINTVTCTFTTNMSESCSGGF